MRQLKYIIAVVLLVLPVMSSAHGLATSFNQTVGNYFIEFEYDTIGSINAGDFQIYNFDILDPNTMEFLDFNRAFIRFNKKGGAVVGLGNAYAAEDFGSGKKSAKLGIIIAEEGDYRVNVIFYDKDNKQLVETTFDFKIDPPYQLPGEKSKTNYFRIYLWSIIIIGSFVLGHYIPKLFKSKKKD